MSEDKLLQIVKDLYKEYENNEIIFNKFIQTIEQLPENLRNTNDAIIYREKRKERLATESELFIKKFLNNNKFYYNSSSDLFFEYKDNSFLMVKEDDIHHAILSTISLNKTLMDWKHRLKITILKKIKERDIFTCIPESETIQNVINKLYPMIFSSKEKAKYFLTIIGDVVLKKTSETYFINSKAKNFLKELNNLSCMFFGSQNLLSIFKYKYYDHIFSECRLIDTQDFISLHSNWNSYFKQNYNFALNLFCVAAYYSKRFENSDSFLINQCKDEKIKEYAFYLKNNNETQIINDFQRKNIEKSEGCSISLKNMQYLWKQYIESEKIPNVFFITKFKSLLCEEYKFDDKADAFMDCTSKSLPRVSKFINFWNTNIETHDDLIEELEIDELSSLIHSEMKINLSDKILLDLIKHFYPDTCIEDDKYLLNTKCKLWDKKKDILEILKKYNNALEIYNSNEEMSINDLYEIYCSSKKKLIASKRYFEKFIKEESQLYIDEENFIKVKSFENI